MLNNYTTILIGNGLGMAVDPDYFRINRGLNYAWSQLDNEPQDRIKNLITDKTNLDNEDQLEKHYEAVQACLMLSKLEKHSNLAWLHPKAKTFPDNFRNFIANTAWHFFNYPTVFTENDALSRLNAFIQNLINYIKTNKTHIVTLNYDGLIYEQIVNSEILKGKLTDGFYIHTNGFHPSNLLNNQRGYYLHLHGSPLFYTDLQTGMINKDRYTTYTQNKDKKNYLREHLILCNTSLKPTQISSSPLLNSYWDFYKKALNQSNKIILFGYSGKDVHVNKEISNVKNREIIIVEHSNQQMEQDARETDWANKLNQQDDCFNESNLLWFDSILDYQFNH